MIRSLPFLGRAISAIRANQHGVAIIEFAYSLPVILAFGLGGLELANLAIAHMRVSQIAMLVADNASRVRTSIDQADVNELFTGAELTAGNIKDFQANARIFLTDLESNGQPSPDSGQYIRWQCSWGTGNYTSSYGSPGDGKTNADLVNGIGPTGNKIIAGTGTAVMFVEVVYTYQPLISNSIFGTKVIRYTSAFNVRERTDQAMKNASSLNLCTTV